ncbi:MSCRAMM family protein [Tsuneonella sp. HG094]
MATGQASYLDANGAGTADDVTYYDLTTKTGDRAKINGGLFFATAPNSTSGTGVINAFVRVQATGNEDGYNTSDHSGTFPNYDENTSPTFTKDLLLSDVPEVTIDGVVYYEFRLDINQLNSAPLISLDKLIIYKSALAAGSAEGTIDGDWFDDNATAVYDIDGTGNTSILLDYSLQAGSGRSDMFFYVPKSNFGGAVENQTLVTLYSEFGATGTLDSTDGITNVDDTITIDGAVSNNADDSPTTIYGSYTTNDGFEEWSVSKAPTGTPIYGYKWQDTDGDGVWDNTELALGGWKFDYTLEYTIEGSGNDPDTVTTVQGTATTDSTGKYTIFLPVADTYKLTITEIPKDGTWFNTFDGSATVNAVLENYTFTANDLPHKQGNTTTADKVSGVFGVAGPMNFGNAQYGSISGTKYEDADGSNATDDDRTVWEHEPVLIQLYKDGVKIAEEYTVDGKYEFTDLLPGDYEVREVDPAGNGWINVTPLTVTLADQESGFEVTDADFANVRYGSIAGTKYEDADGSNATDDDRTVWEHEPVLIQLYKDGVKIAEEYTVDGKYEFTDLLPGDYEVREVDPAGNGWINVTPLTVTLADQESGFEVTDADFANVRYGSIAGTKYEDADGSNATDDDRTVWEHEPVLIQLYKDGVKIAEEYTVDGKYEFTDLLPGDYEVREVDPAGNGWINVTPLTVTLADQESGFEVTDADFANVRYGSIAGTKYEDADGSNATDDDRTVWEHEPVLIQLYKDGVKIAEEYTVDGKYEFTDLLPGDYEVREVDPAGNGWINVTPLTVTLADQESGFEVTDADFANVRYGSIAGTKYEDADGSNATDDDRTVWEHEPVLIQLYKDGVKIAEEYTVDGKYEFTDLLPGDYEVREVDPAGNGWINVTPLTVTLADQESGFEVTDADFTNVKFGEISGYKLEDLDGEVGGETQTWTGGAVTIVLLDGNGDPVLDGNGDPITTTTDPLTGYYEFTDLLPGTYTVAEETPEGSYAVIGEVDVGTVESGFVASNVNLTNFVPDPEIAIQKYVKTNVVPTYQDEDDPDGSAASTSNIVQFKVTLTNTGNVALTAIAMEDYVIDDGVLATKTTIDYNDPALGAWVDLNRNGTQEAGEDWIALDGDGDMILENVVLAVNDDPNTDEVEDQLDIYYSLDSRLGQHENTASVKAEDVYIGKETNTVSDDANYYVLDEDCVGVGTPGFWSNNGFKFWNGHNGDEDKQEGKPGFAEDELLYAVDHDGNGSISPIDSSGDGFVNLLAKDGLNDAKPLDNAKTAGLLIGDYNQNGLTDANEDTIFISYEDAVSLINASNRQTNGGQADGIWMVGRDVVATWLNFLANNPDAGQTDCIGTVDGADGYLTPRESIDAAIDWLQQFASNKNSDDTKSDGIKNNGDEYLDTDTNTNTNFHEAIKTAIFEFDAKIATSTTSWNSKSLPGEDLALSGSQIHSALDEYNNDGKVNGVEYCCDRDDAEAIDAMTQVDAWQASLLGSNDQTLQDQSQLMYTQTLVAV